MKRFILAAALTLGTFTHAADAKSQAQGALIAAEAAIIKGDEKEAGRQLKLYRKAMQRLRFERRLKKAAEELKKVDLPTLKDV